MGFRYQRLCIWSGLAMLLCFGLAVWPLAQFLPPPTAHESAEQIARLYRGHSTGIRLAALAMILGGILYFAFSIAISLQIQRVEGQRSPLAWLQLGGGMLNAVLFLLIALFLAAGAFRAGRDPRDVQLCNDAVWIMMVVPTFPVITQLLCITLAVFGETSPRPAFPRWFGYYNAWTMTMFVPGMLSLFFKRGPLAWQGVLSFWLEAVAFSIWPAVTTVVLLRAARKEEAAALPGDASLAVAAGVALR
jgi:hypothetical protein